MLRKVFKYDDYWPFMAGLFGIGGLLAVPLIWGQIGDLTYLEATPGSLLGCVVYAYGVTRHGEFRTGRFIGALVVAILLVMRSDSLILPGGILGFLVMGGCGWIGIAAGRATGLSSPFETPSPADLPDPADLDETMLKLVEESTRPSLARFLASTHIAWKGGHLEAHSSFFRVEASKTDVKTFVEANTEAIGRAFATIDRDAPFVTGEYLVAQTEEFFLTNHRLLWGLQRPTISMVSLRDILRYELKRGGKHIDIQLSLEDGRSLTFPGFTAPPDEAIIKALVEAERERSPS